LPAWALVSVVAFCALELTLLAYTRTVSGVGHLHAVQDVSVEDISAGTAAAVCTEGLAAVDDFWPAVPLLNVGRILPVSSAHAWGQVPLLVDVARQTCPSVQLYATVAPSLDRSLKDGVAADLLSGVRGNEPQLLAASQQVASAWSQLESVDVSALSGDARLARAGRAIESLRQQQADISDAFALLTPQTLESVLGGGGPRALVLNVVDSARSYLVMDQGKVVTIGIGEPRAPTVGIVWVDQAGLASLRATLTRAVIPDQAHDSVIAEALLLQVVQQPLIDNEAVAADLKHAADDHHAWFWFDDPRLQELVTRRGWVRQ
jgi:hypothetical protein